MRIIRGWTIPDQVVGILQDELRQQLAEEIDRASAAYDTCSPWRGGMREAMRIVAPAEEVVGT